MRRQTAEHPFGTIKCRMGATHFLTKRLPKVAAEMALNVLAYNMKRVMAIIGVATGGLGGLSQERLTKSTPAVCLRAHLGRLGGDTAQIGAP
jgi:hypothetical protein